MTARVKTLTGGVVGQVAHLEVESRSKSVMV